MTEPGAVVDLRGVLATFSELWSPRTVAEANGWEIKLAKVHGEFVWHEHDVDEVFLVVEGALTIELDAGARQVPLSAGQVFVVPRGTPHRPVAENVCHILLLEPAGVVNTGDAGGELTAPSRWA